MGVSTGSGYFLTNFGLKIINKFGNLNELYEREIFEDLLVYKTLQDEFDIKLSKKLHSTEFLNYLSSFFKELNDNDPKLNTLITLWISHFYIIEDGYGDYDVPCLIKFNNKIFIEMNNEFPFYSDYH